jgi:glycosyltransferase involved in cell wall biosynthesis
MIFKVTLEHLRHDLPLKLLVLEARHKWAPACSIELKQCEAIRYRSLTGVETSPRSVRSEEDRVEWHIITGEYPPQWGGVSDYTYQVSHELAKGGDRVHVWSPAHTDFFHSETTEIHALPRGFGWRWLRELSQGLRSYQAPRNILIQYVPHMYGWKSMNLAFCWWIFTQRKHNVCVMFHEVAFPFRAGQRFRHGFLAVVHRMMAWAILRSVRHSFTSTEPYMALLQSLGSERTPISLLRICSNIPMESYESNGLSGNHERPNDLFTVGVFSNFGPELRKVLDPAIGCIIDNPKIEVLLLGPGESFRQSLAKKYPHAADRIRSTGRLRVNRVAEHMRRCDALLQLYPDGASAARGTLIGALASGVPVVTTSGPATDRLLLDSAAMLFPSGSPESIRDAIELLRNDPALCRELAALAQNLYRESFQPAVIVSRIRDAVSCANGEDKELVGEEPALQD